MKREKIWQAALFTYIVIIFYFAVLNRDYGVGTALRLNLFWGYNNPDDDILRDNILNIVLFMPIGILVGLITKKKKMVKALAIGLIISLTIECLQLLFKKGTFDVDDLFNNSLGALIGGLLVWAAISVKKKRLVNG